MTRDLRRAPASVMCAVALAVLIWWAADQGGYGVTKWAPGMLVALALLAAAVITVPNAWGDVPRVVVVAAALLAGYAAWSFLSIAWADDPGAAWTGAARTLLFVAVFCLFALWPQRPRTAELLLLAWTFAIGAVAVVLLARIALGDERRFFSEGLLTSPAGYHNAAALTFAMALFPAIVMAAARTLHPLLRAACAFVAVVCADTALLAQSRGSVYSLAVCAVLLLAIVPGRLRVAGAFAVCVVAAVAAAPSVLDVRDAFDGGDPAGAVESAVQAVLLLALLAAVVVGAAAWWETARTPSADVQREIARWGRVAAATAVVLGAVAAIVATGSPVASARDGWRTFKGGYGANDPSKPRLTTGLGSNRYDFYRVSLDEFAAHPIAGIGADNFRIAYLRHGKSTETPRYPHSLELRTLAQTGLVGALLLFGALAAAAVAVARIIRARDERTGVVAAAAAIAVVYWLVHGSVDWFFEYAGLSAAAFALLGLVCALAPRHDPPRAFAVQARSPAAIAAVVAGLAVCALPALSLWASQRDVDAAADVFATAPGEAYDRLDRASRLNPFAADARRLEGSIALRRNDLVRADAAFALALERVPGDQYATLERGAIASARGDLPRARVLLDRAVALAPRDTLAREVRDIVRDGGTIEIAELNERIRRASATLGG